MKSKILSCVSALCGLMVGAPAVARAQGTAFTYQGRLSDAGTPATGLYDLQFQAFPTSSGSFGFPGILTNAATLVSNGLFRVTLDLGSNVFNGGTVWLEIGVRTNSSGAAFAMLTPRQQLTPVPQAIYAELAGAATAANSLSPNAVVTSSIQDGAVTAAKVAPGQLVKSVNGLTENVLLAAGANITVTTNGNSLRIASSGGVTSGWALGGNAGTTNGNFIGTTDVQAMEMRANGQRAMRLEPDVSGKNAPNVIGGSPLNFVGSGSIGATIGGGGTSDINGSPGVNSVTGKFGTVAGGAGNTVSGVDATVGGGVYNIASGIEATVAGGGLNSATNFNATVGGGGGNLATGQYSTIPGGENNTAGGTGSFAAGRNAHASHDGSFIWGDGSQAANSTGPNRFEINAFGGINFYPGAANVSIATPSALAFGASSRQMVNLYDDGTYKFGIGVQTSTLYLRSGATYGGFAWYKGGAHTNTQNDPGPGGATLMLLDASGSLTVSGGVAAETVAANASLATAVSGIAGFGKGVYGKATSAGPNFAGVWGENTADGGTAVVAKALGNNSTGLYSTGTANAGYFDGNLKVNGTATINGTAIVNVLTVTGGSDVAEPFHISGGDIPKGSVVVIDEDVAGKLKLSCQAYDQRVAGIVSGANGINAGIALHQEGALEGGQNVALSGRVYVLADASTGAIRPGDLLTTSFTPGHAMKVADYRHAQGAILGKAMSSLKAGRGTVLVLVSLQ